MNMRIEDARREERVFAIVVALLFGVPAALAIAAFLILGLAL